MTDNDKKIDINLKSVENLKDHLNSLDYKLKNGLINPSDIDFVPLFQSIQDLIDQDNLETILKDIGDTSSIFKEKIKEIQDYLNQAVMDDAFKVFIKNIDGNDNSLSFLLKKCWKPPLILENLSLQQLQKSYIQLINKKNIKERFKFIDPERIESVDSINVNFLEESFQKSIQKFHIDIKKKMPCSIDKILDEARTPDEYYNWFIYILHLIQKHKIIYDKNQREISEFK